MTLNIVTINSLPASGIFALLAADSEAIWESRPTRAPAAPDCKELSEGGAGGWLGGKDGDEGITRDIPSFEAP